MDATFDRVDRSHSLRDEKSRLTEVFLPSSKFEPQSRCHPTFTLSFNETDRGDGRLGSRSMEMDMFPLAVDLMPDARFLLGDGDELARRIESLSHSDVRDHRSAGH